jgi:hypothetical protein
LLFLTLSNSSISEQATVSESLLKIDGHNKSTIFHNNSRFGLSSIFFNSSVYSSNFSIFVAIVYKSNNKVI